MRGRTWLGAALVLGAQLRGKETWPRPASFPSSDSLNYPQGRGFSPCPCCDSSCAGFAGSGTKWLSFFPNRFGRIREEEHGSLPLISSTFNVLFSPARNLNFTLSLFFFFFFFPPTFVPKQSGIVRELRLQILHTAKVPGWHETHLNFRWFISKPHDFKNNASSSPKRISTRM